MSSTPPCPYVPLSAYDWSLYDILTGPRGRCFGVSLAFNPAVWCLTAAIHAATVWMAVGLNLQLFGTFKRWRGCYFWSILITTWGILIVTVLWWDIQNFTRAGDRDALQWIQAVAWIVESMGFSFVLYSRLHLIEDSAKLRILPFFIIIFDATVHILVLVGKAGHLTAHGWRTLIFFTPIFFTIQETILASLYIYLFIRFMRNVCYGTRTRSMFRFLIAGEMVIICFDVAMVTLNSLHYEIAKTILTPFFYASKLKIEFMVLNRLMVFTQNAGELIYTDSNGGQGMTSPSTGDHDTDTNQGSSTMRWADEVLESDGKTSYGQQNAVYEARSGMPADGSESDDISRLERQYLGRGCLLFARAGTEGS